MAKALVCFQTFPLFTFNTKQDKHYTPTYFSSTSESTRLTHFNCIYIQSDCLFRIWENTAAAKWERHSREGDNTHVPISHPVLHDMFTPAPVEGCLPHVCCWLAWLCSGVNCVFVCECSDKSFRRQTAPPRCSPQRLWLAILSRTETSASICVAAPRPYWWATTSYDKRGCVAARLLEENHGQDKKPARDSGATTLRPDKQTALLLRHHNK